MATYKVLAQSAPSPVTNTTLYTATNATIVSTLNACNIGGNLDLIRIAVRPAGATLAAEHYIAYNVPLQAGEVLSIQAGITLASTDVLTIYSTTGATSFSAFGSENN